MNICALRPFTNWTLWLFAAAVMAYGSHANAQPTKAQIVAYTEDWAPYNFAEDGAVKGISTDLLRAMCVEAKLQCEFKLVPWARAYKAAGAKPNTIVYTTARKPSRESEFLWVGPILPRTTWVYGKAGLESKVRLPSDLHQLRIGIVRDEAAQQDLQGLGVPDSTFVEDSSNANVLKLLSRGLVDAMVDTEVGMDWNLRNANLSSNSVGKLMKLSEGGSYFFAMNLNSDPGYVERLQQALDKLRRDGKVTAIVRKYTAPSH
ncbi:substrate-binding periplasmic protein [Rhodoferax aquaticus]|uniref:substrate-binding periplasmic protein n=1 Tax=Rhodoferax aquaticus TaxID=2527691 RepID=UPI00143DCDE0|nr:transporter substrate-binding domain-containing protein [Rhodoferax aquaticus]